MPVGFGVSDYIETTYVPASGQPFTACGWVARHTGSVADRCMWCLDNSGTINTDWFIGISSTNKASLGFKNFSAGSVVSGGTLTNSAWNHILAVVRSASDRSIYLNGTETNDTTSITEPTGINRCTVGARRSTTTLSYAANGSYIFEGLGFWNVALTAAEIASLAAGAPPLNIRRAGLREVAPLKGLAEGYGWMASPAFALGSGASISSAPPGWASPMRWPRRRRIQSVG